jgi:thioredoxin-related protein
MKNRRIFFLLLFLFSSVSSISQMDSLVQNEGGALTWYTNLQQATEISNATHKPIFAFFTGSDWCGWCHKLQADVYSKPAFVQWAKENVVLLEVDFPRKSVLSPELIKQNSDLQQAFQVRGYPTIFLFFLKIKDLKYEVENLGSLGYPQGFEEGKAEVKFIADANLILRNKK